MKVDAGQVWRYGAYGSEVLALVVANRESGVGPKYPTQVVYEVNGKVFAVPGKVWANSFFYQRKADSLQAAGLQAKKNAPLTDAYKRHVNVVEAGKGTHSLDIDGQMFVSLTAAYHKARELGFIGSYATFCTRVQSGKDTWKALLENPAAQNSATRGHKAAATMRAKKAKKDFLSRSTGQATRWTEGKAAALQAAEAVDQRKREIAEHQARESEGDAD